VNYFLKDRNGAWLNEKNDKAIWLKWMELRVNNKADALLTPTGSIPLYSDLKTLFAEVLQKQYQKQEYVKQFTTRVNENLEKIQRMETIFRTRILDTPAVVFTVLKDQQNRLLDAQRAFGNYISPEQW
jgi:phosphoenolpyruvate carboxykinase (GTP)